SAQARLRQRDAGPRGPRGGVHTIPRVDRGRRGHLGGGGIMTRLLVIVNDVNSQPGLLTQWMISENVAFDLRIGGVSPLPAPSALEGYNGLITLGGGYMPDETDRAPWLAEGAALVRHSLDAELPQLGSCRGGRLVAQVTGREGRARTAAPEKRYTAVRPAAEAADDPVFSASRERTSFLESHVDRIVELPVGATLLASSEACE